MLKPVHIILMGLSLFFLSCPAWAGMPGAPEYRVTDVEGEVGFTPRGSDRVSPVVKDMSLQSGDRLVTGKSGRVELATKQGTVMELKEDSSLEVESFSTEVSRFFLRVGRLLGKFAPASQTKHSYAIRTPVAVAAVRGTELALCVEEDGETQGGVIEGVVAFERPSDEKTGAAGDEVTVEANKGVMIKPHEAMAKMTSMPPLVVKDLTWFPHVRERIPTLRERWKDLLPPAKRELRQGALRQRIQWQVPARHLRELTSPQQRQKDNFHSPAHPQPEKPHPHSPQPSQPDQRP